MNMLAEISRKIDEAIVARDEGDTAAADQHLAQAKKLMGYLSNRKRAAGQELLDKAIDAMEQKQ